MQKLSLFSQINPSPPSTQNNHLSLALSLISRLSPHALSLYACLSLTPRIPPSHSKNTQNHIRNSCSSNIALSLTVETSKIAEIDVRWECYGMLCDFCIFSSQISDGCPTGMLCNFYIFS
ncbi:hypothetical protein AMTRI_Chr11g153170 [Amborella trichopoda]